MHFKDVVADPAQFRALMGEPPPPCVAKTIAVLDQHCRAFIARSPFVLIASSDALGKMDISPREMLQVLFESWMIGHWLFQTDPEIVALTRSQMSYKIQKLGSSFSFQEKAKPYASAGAPKSFAIRMFVNRWQLAAKHGVPLRRNNVHMIRTLKILSRQKTTPGAQLMARTLEFDVLQCLRCGGRMKIIAAIESPEVARRILRLSRNRIPSAGPAPGPPANRTIRQC